MAKYSVEIASGQAVSDRRAVAFLTVDPPEDYVNSKDVYDSLPDNAKNQLRSRIDSWIQGHTNDNWYHGWKPSHHGGLYSECFVFKVKIRRQHQRFYGYLMNPRDSDQRFRVCLLILHTPKDQHETEVSDLKRVKTIAEREEVKSATRKCFEE